MSLYERLVETTALKALPRTGWLRRGVERPESVSAHSWGVAWLVVVLLPPELNRELALTFATIHDVAEVRVGDITPHDGISPADKAALEEDAMRALSDTLPPHVFQAWLQYERQDTPEARFVRQLDRLDMALQAVAYARTGASGMREFAESAARVIEHPALLPLLHAAVAELES